MHPAVIWRVEKGDGVVHGWLVDSSWSVWRVAINRQCIPQSEEQ